MPGPRFRYNTQLVLQHAAPVFRYAVGLKDWAIAASDLSDAEFLKLLGA